jgi:hypothetical protein
MAKSRAKTDLAQERAPWLQRSVRLPRPLHALFGEAPRNYELLAVCASGLAAAAIVLLLGGIAAPEVRLWRRILVAIIALDVAAGAVACTVPSGAAYYATFPWRRRVFIAVHAAYPAVLAALFPDSAVFLALVGAYTLAAAYAVDALGSSEAARVASTALVAAGAVFFCVIGSPGPLLVWFAPLYLLKLVAGFAARR